MAGMDLSNRDVQAMLRMTRQYDGIAEDEVLPEELYEDLIALVRCDELSVVGQDSARHSIFAGQGEGEIEDEVSEPDDPFWVHYPDSLGCSYPCRSGDIASVTMASDFCSLRQQRNTAMYDFMLRAYGRFDYEIMVCLPVGPAHTRTLRLLFFRERGSDFTDRDRAVLTLLRPHLHAAYLAARRSRPGFTPLTTRQLEILRYVAAGYSNHQIARRLYVAEGTVRKHLENAFARLQVTSRAAAVVRAGPELWSAGASNPLYVRSRVPELAAPADDDASVSQD